MDGVIMESRAELKLKMNAIFCAIHNIQNEYNWLITDIDVAPLKQGNNILSMVDYIWVPGIELSRFIDEYFWMFGVFSGFQKNISKDEVLKYKLPYADGNPSFWHNPPQIQHQLADVEFVTWDSTYYLFFSKDNKIINDLMSAYPFAENIETYNIRNNG